MGTEVEGVRDGDTFYKTALTDAAQQALVREAFFLSTNSQHLARLGAPACRGPVTFRDAERFAYQYVGPHTDPHLRDELVVFDELIKRLEALRELGLRHGDLTRANMIWNVDGDAVDPGLYVTDWGDAGPLSQRPRKQPERDVVTALRAMPEWGIDTSRIARRWIAILGHEGRAHAGTYEAATGPMLYDYGAFRGRISRLARASGYQVLAIDREATVLPDQGKYLATLTADLTSPEALPARLQAHGLLPERNSVGLLLSVLPYVIDEAGWDVAEFLIRTLTAWHRTLYVECQCAGDGPGPAEMPDQRAWWRWLDNFGQVDVVTDLPVAGREPRTRAVFAIRE